MICVDHVGGALSCAGRDCMCSNYHYYKPNGRDCELIRCPTPNNPTNGQYVTENNGYDVRIKIVFFFCMSSAAVWGE